MKTTNKQKSLILAVVMTAATGSVFASGVNNTIAPNAAALGADAVGNTNTVTASGSFSLGHGNTVSGANALATGTNNKVSGLGALVGGINAEVNGNNSIAFGDSAKALAADVYAIGRKATASAANTVVLGNNSTAEKTMATAVGYNNHSTDTYTTTVGYSNTASGNESTALGFQNTASGYNATAVGSENNSSATLSNSLGYKNIASNENATAVGGFNTASGNGSFAAGLLSSATKQDSLAIGHTAVATGDSSIAIGSNATATKGWNIAIGHLNKANGISSIVLGSDATSESDNSLAVGNSTHATAVNATAIGQLAQATGMSSVAIGHFINSTGYGAVNIGHNNSDTNKRSVTIGTGNYVTYTDHLDDPEGDIAIGANNQSTDSYHSINIGKDNVISSANYGIALGNGASVTAENSIAIGKESKADRVATTATGTIGTKTVNFAGTATGTVSVGDVGKERTITNVAAGEVSVTSTDAINGSQLHATIKAVEKNHQDILDTAKGVEMLGNIVATNATNIKQNHDDIVDVTKAVQTLGDVVSDNTTAIEANKQAASNAMTEATKHSSVTAGNNIEVTTSTNGNGGTEYNVSLKKDASFDNIKFGTDMDPVHNAVNKDGMYVFNGDVDTKFDSNGVFIENRNNLDTATHNINGVTADSNGKHVAFTTDGIDAGKQVISNVSNGIKNSDVATIGQLKANTSTEAVVADNQVDNIATVRVINGKSTGDANAQYGVYVSHSTVDAIAKASNRFAGDDVIKVERWKSPSIGADLTTFKYDATKAAAKTALIYKSNGVTETTMLTDGLDFANGNNTTAYVGSNGVVKYDLNKDITVDSVTAGKANIGGVTVDNNGIDLGGKAITNVGRGTGVNDVATVGQLNDVRNAMSNADANTLGHANAYTDSRVSETTAQNAALSALHPLEFNKNDKFQVATGVGNYKNKTSIALGVFYQPNENTLLSLGTTLGAHRNVVNAGATFHFGKHSEMNTDRHDALETKVKSLEETLADISAKYDELLKKVETK